MDTPIVEQNTKNIRRPKTTLDVTCDLPLLDPEEHAWIESLTGRALSNEEAQMLLREAKLTASWEDIYGKRKGVAIHAAA